MIPTNDAALFDEAIRQLGLYRASIGSTYKGRFVQLFLGLKFFQNSIPSMHSGAYARTEAIQGMLDDLFAKASRSPNECVLMLFKASFLARTGLTGPGNTVPQNTWRNNLNLQKGVGCYAPPGTLSSQAFQDQDRSACQFLIPGPTGTFDGARCSLNPQATYRSEAHRKWLRIDPGGNGYAAVDPMAIDNFLPYVAPGGKRIPLLPLIAALYFDGDPGLIIGQRTAVSAAEFALDFNLSDQEVLSYFDDAASNSFNAAVLAAFPALASYNAPGPLTVGGPSSGIGSGGSPVYPAAPPTFTGGVPILSGTVVTPPAVNTGWGAQQFVLEALRLDGWAVFDVSNQALGYDIVAKKGVRTIYVEVKSSTSTCSPSLTSREWFQAKRLTSNYVLAIIENFSDQSANTVFWISDPAGKCVASAQITTSYRIARSSWQKVAGSIAHL